MIIDEGKIINKKNKFRKLVTRICDDCGNKREVLMSQIIQSHNKRGNDKDYCKKCSYKYRILDHPTGDKSKSWHGGRTVSSTGYNRIYNFDSGKRRYEYEHKVILSNYLGRKLSVEEKIHHVDLNKINNAIENLFLCKDKADHWKCHQSMEECGFLMFDKKIWFDRKSKLYTCEYLESKFGNINVEDILFLKSYKAKRRDGGKYYLCPTNKENGRHIHILVAERMYGKKLMASETVHHINGDTLNNHPDNLCLMTRREHKLCHYSLQNCVAKLFIVGSVGFNDGKYFIKDVAQ